MKVLLFLTIFFSMTHQERFPDISQVRRLYAAAASQKDSARKLSEILAPIDSGAGKSLLLGYKGAAEMVMAKYAINPISKLNHFKKGKTWMESAVQNDSMEVELRYLRFTIQSNSPSFLAYQQNIEADKSFLITNFVSIKDLELKKMVSQYLATSKYCTVDDVKKIQL